MTGFKAISPLASAASSRGGGWRRTIAVLIVLVVAAACSDNLLVANLTTASGSLTGAPGDAEIDREAVENLPYATIAAKIGNAPRAVLVLGHYEGAELHWFAANNTALVTQNGRLIQTVGLESNLRGTYLSVPDPVAQGPHRLQDSVRFRREIELGEDRRESAVLVSELVPEETEMITIAGYDYETLRLRETNAAIGINWQFENYFWVDVSDGYVWQSSQHFTPDMPPILLQILKPEY